MDGIPLCNIRIDKEGVWYYGDEEIFRKEIVLFFYENLKRDPSGRYLIELGDERCYVDVEDTPFIVKSLDRTLSEGDNGEIIYIYLSDGTVEALDTDSLWVGRDNVLYCTTRNKTSRVRFSRASYYQIARYIEYDTENNAYFIPLNGKSFYIKKSFENCTRQF
jgi:hypothetical protein